MYMPRATTKYVDAECQYQICTCRMPIPNMQIHPGQYQICRSLIPIANMCMPHANTKYVYVTCQCQICMYALCQYQICKCRMPMPAMYMPHANNKVCMPHANTTHFLWHKRAEEIYLMIIIVSRTISSVAIVINCI